jgi:ornithine cyclodeaminase
MEDAMPEHEILYLTRKDIDRLELSVEEIMQQVELGLKCHGEKKVVMPPKAYLDLEEKYKGHFNILRAFVEPIETAGVKVIGDYVNNFQENLASELALLTLYNPRNGLPMAIMDATTLTWMRTGAVTAIGAKYLARKDAGIIGHIGARGTAGMNIRALCTLFDIKEVRVTSKRTSSREDFAEMLRQNFHIPIEAKETVEETVKDADIIVEATRMTKPETLIRKEWMKPGALIIPYGWMMAVDPDLPFEMDKLVVDDWIQCQQGGSLFPLIKDGRLLEEHIHGEIGEICAGIKPGRTNPSEKILFWHRGFAISDVMIGSLALEKAKALGIGQRLPYFCFDGEVM